MNNLAALSKSQGKYEVAEPLYVDALPMRKKLLGEEHPYVASAALAKVIHQIFTETFVTSHDNVFQ
ncbi:tetratricopeptide repeat protein [Crocosphaera watsonii]|uniref:Kinesin light chain n=1 Tax=Crocosphaera watsonii WH 8501 TaxID=165597 RepID=Q4C2W6_CROWT|nr:tetratricopeptide repeat protein [Crocosphaera watsonii]EAM50519.1 hypothetical protein CwatDRAFT_3836 [Crocosphaera watsonii WH 8501]